MFGGQVLLCYLFFVIGNLFFIVGCLFAIASQNLCNVIVIFYESRGLLTPLPPRFKT